MASTIHLVRHGHHALLGQILCGRMSGVQLDDLGRREMAGCAASLDPPPSAIQSSPRRRALQSASILAEYLRRPIEICPAVDELDYGEWTGRAFANLDNDPRWSAWNTRRGSSRPPAGESMRDLQHRMVGHIEQLRRDDTIDTIAIVSHAEPIRAALLYYSRISLDRFFSIQVDPASVSTLSADGQGIRITRINQRVPA
jgi:broad specificity phosphatase PhoE